ncbi:MAG: hypothetical protein NTV30_09125 [Chloroflexi bacterium]|nr:hypothetical protein [Chloroflexota bacterium]
MKEVFKVLNPESWMSAFDTIPLNTRLDNLKGKVIGIIGQDHEPMIYLKDALKAAVPEIRDIIIFKEKQRFGERGGIDKAIREEVNKFGINAAIQGIAH